MRPIALTLALVLAACGQQMSPQEKAARDAEDVAEVVAASEAPAVPVTPQVIRYPDIEQHEMYGVGCSFTPDGGGLGATAITLLDAGYMRIGGAIETFAPDAGSEETPAGTRSRYDGLRYAMQLTLLEREGERTGRETSEYDARLELRDGQGRVVYASDGYAQCGA